MYCQNCGKEVTGNFCQNCGAAVTIQPSTNVSTKTTSKGFKVLSIISSAFCGLSLFFYLMSTLSEDSTDIRVAILLIGITLTFVMSVIPAALIQPAKQGLSALFYVLSCAGLLFVGFVGLPHSLLVTAICVISVVLVITTAIFGKNTPKKPIQAKKIIAAFAVLLVLSVGIVAGERITNKQRNERLSDVTINGVSLTQEQLDFIDEDYIIRRGLHHELTAEKIGDYGYSRSENQSAIIPGTEYFSANYPSVNYLQIENSFLSYTDNNSLSTYSVTYIPVKLDNENLRKVIEVYSEITGGNFSCDDKTYTFNDIISAPIPSDGSISYSYISPVDSEINISISIRVNRNGYATLDINYMFPVAE